MTNLYEIVINVEASDEYEAISMVYDDVLDKLRDAQVREIAEDIYNEAGENEDGE